MMALKFSTNSDESNSKKQLGFCRTDISLIRLIIGSQVWTIKGSKIQNVHIFGLSACLNGAPAMLFLD